MKAIVANVLFGSIFGCLSCTNSASANPQPFPLSVRKQPASPIFAAKLLSKGQSPLIPQIVDAIDRISTVDQLDIQNLRFAEKIKINLEDNSGGKLNSNGANASLGKLPYTHREEQANLVVGFQKTFWASQNKGKYWGVTTIERWGKSDFIPQRPQKSSKLNYLNSAPVLPAGTATLTLSGGGKDNLTKVNQTNPKSQEFQDFRGGVTYHRGIAEQVTMGVGFVYEDALVGFTQLTYKSDVLPLQTTVSLMAKESSFDLHSRVSLKPADNIVLNYYKDPQKYRFDAKWGIIPGLDLIAKSNSKDKSFSTGVKVAIHSDFISLSADAALDNNNNLQWNVKSRIGGLKFAYSNDRQKTSSDLAFQLLDSDTYGVRCSAFVQQKIRLHKGDTKEFANWGMRLESAKTVSKNRHQWTVNLGYGSGSHGQGLILNGSVALKSDMFLNLSYEAISQKSDDTKVKVLLSSK